MQAKTSKRINGPERSVIDPAMALPDNLPLLKLGINSDPWAALDAIMATEPEPTGNGWFTVIDFAKRYNMSRSGAQSRCQKLLITGKADTWIGVAASTGNVTRKYRVK